MSQVNYLLENMRTNPRDWRIEQLEIITKFYRVSIRKSSGSHVVFAHPNWEMSLCVLVKKIVNLIDYLEIIYEQTKKS